MRMNIAGQEVEATPMSEAQIEAQTVDPRSRMAEMSEDPERGVRITGPTTLRGRRVFLVSGLNPVGLLRLHTPNFKALMLNLSKRCYEQAEAARKCGQDPGLGAEEQERLSMDWMENMAGAIIAARCAIESFANEHLSDEEKGSNLVDDKLKQHLPQKLDKGRPTQTQWWPGLRRMIEGVRNELVHERGTVMQDEKTVDAWNALVALKEPPHELAYRLIKHFLGEEEKWIEKFSPETSLDGRK